MGGPERAFPRWTVEGVLDRPGLSVFHPWPIPPPSRRNCSRDLELLAEIGYEYMEFAPVPTKAFLPSYLSEGFL